MKYVGVVAMLDGVPDSVGDILSSDVKLPENLVSVSHEFTDKVIGLASLKRDGSNIVAEIDIDESTLEPSAVEQFKAVVGGRIFERDSNVIRRWDVISIGLTIKPCDTRLPNLKRVK